MGLFSFCFAGGGFVMIGIWEALFSSYLHLNSSSSVSPPVSPPRSSSNQQTTRRKNRRPDSMFISVRYVSVGFLSLFFILDSVISSSDALNIKDQVGFSLQLDIFSISSLFFLYSVAGLLSNSTNFLPIPVSLLNLIGLFGFGQELVFFYVQRKDPNGIENRYFDMLLVPITICILSTLLEMGSPKSNLPGLGRGFGLILHGTWFIQMGFSFYTDIMVHGCALHEASRGNFTVKCKGHMDSHRGKAIATLQFNCHLALLVILIVGFYSFIGNKFGFPGGDYSSYKPLNAELHQLGNQTQFTLDSDDEESSLEENAAQQKTNSSIVPVSSEVNGFGNH
ncbi:hypothetical protein C5167_042381 [Papaver somniferum]|uniref:Uncharacterized protein n=1 Tax=Papaver somniferum TaxID=3469 RepID=A0A4Y7L594_PAPSO|nr:uncharacterized protein LOC113319722 [Papaver somniferum]RZC79800.1 hypothetical protein C5167_042381 [Papaver somniferum]